MATLKLKPKNPAAPRGPARGPVRGSGSGVRARPTLAEAQAERIEREARYQAQLTERQQAGPPGAPPRRAAEQGPRGGPPGAPRGRGRADGPRDTSRGPQADGRHPSPTWDEQAHSGPHPGDRPPGPHERPDPPRRPGQPLAPERPTGFGRRPDAPRGGAPGARRDGARGGQPEFAARQDGPRGGRGPRRDGPGSGAHEFAPRTDAPRRGASDPRGNQAFGPRDAPAGPRAGGRPARPPLEPARRHDPTQHRPRPEAREPQERPEPTSAPGSLRLSKYMGQLGIASRREADEWIEKGWVRVDGRVVSELGSRVMPGQQVTVDAQAKYVQAQKVTVLINKPVGYVSGQAEDGYEPALVLVKPANQWREDQSGTRWLPQHLRSLVPAGRLDIDSVGLLVLTQDGRVAKQLVGEHSEIEKEYLVRVASAEGGGGLGDDGLALLRHGLELDGEPLREAHVEWVNEDQLRFVLREGKKRQIRRMCEAVGLQVLGLKRVRIGRVMLGDLPAGQWRYLRADEGFL